MQYRTYLESLQPAPNIKLLSSVVRDETLPDTNFQEDSELLLVWVQEDVGLLRFEYLFEMGMTVS